MIWLCWSLVTLFLLSGIYLYGLKYGIVLFDHVEIISKTSKVEKKELISELGLIIFSSVFYLIGWAYILVLILFLLLSKLRPVYSNTLYKYVTKIGDALVSFINRIIS